MDCSGRRRAYSQRTSGASKISRASAGVGAPAGRAAQLGRAAAGADEGVPEVQRHLAAEDLRHQLPADGEAGSGRGVVDPGRLERHPLVGPAHRPVDLPGQLPGHLGDRHRADLGSAGAGVGDLGGLVVEAGDRGVVAPADGAVGPERVVGPGARVLRVVVVGLGVSLGLVPGQHRADVGPAPHGEDDLLGVGAGGVHLGLADLGDPDAEPGQRLAQRLLEVLGPALVPAAGVGHRGQRPADVLGERLSEAGRNPAQPVVVVPGQDVPGGHALLADLVRDQVRHHQLAQVAQVHGPGRADPRRARRRLAGMPAFCFGAHLAGCAHHPVIGRSHGTGHLHRHSAAISVPVLAGPPRTDY